MSGTEVVGCGHITAGWCTRCVFMLPPPSNNGAMSDVLAERARQDAKWGEQNHDPFVYGAILTEEVGEFMQAALKARFESDDARISIGYMQDMRAEAVQCAAVALAIVEMLDRGKWTWGGHRIGGTDSLLERPNADEPPERLAILDGLTGWARVEAAHNAALHCEDPACSWCNPRGVVAT